MKQCNLLDSTQEPSDEALAGLMQRVTQKVVARASLVETKCASNVVLISQLTPAQIKQKIKEETVRAKLAWEMSHRKSA